LKGRRDKYGELSLRELIEDYTTHTAMRLGQTLSAAVAYENKPQD
jgi:hypothetical protein